MRLSPGSLCSEKHNLLVEDHDLPGLAHRHADSRALVDGQVGVGSPEDREVLCDEAPEHASRVGDLHASLLATDLAKNSRCGRGELCESLTEHICSPYFGFAYTYIFYINI